MLYPSINDLLEKAENQYILVNEVAKRARQIVEVEGRNKGYIDEMAGKRAERAKENGCSGSVAVDKKPVSIATLEVFDGEISYISGSAEEKDEIREMMDLANLEAFLNEQEEQEEEML
ncbi:MAG: DNA-directed RNA polymerase subunit omega [Peptostreptococcaceae bacterium]|nr:DNA-directed RNA polymerase subunit omega [Peptostreptococcaceae bacterium]